MNDNGRVKITIRNVLLREHSRQQMLQVVNFVGEDPMRLKALIEIFLSGTIVLRRGLPGRKAIVQKKSSFKVTPLFY